MDEITCLRAGSLNIFKGMTCPNYCCDASHYMPGDEFLEKRPGFWPGTGLSVITRKNQRNRPCKANCKLSPENSRLNELVPACNLSCPALPRSKAADSR
jgi:hypothetical protein